MEIKVREVSAVQDKSSVEVEQELLDKHEQSLEDETNEVEPTGVEQSTESSTTEEEQEAVQQETQTQVEQSDDSGQLTEESVLSFIKDRYNREINSFDELLSAREEATEIPEDVKSFLEYKQETGRGINDYLKLQEDFDSKNPDDLLREYFLQTEEGLDAEDIEIMMENFSYDEDLDDESDVKKVKLAKKKAIAKAKSYFNEQKEKYRQPVESTASSVSNEQMEKIEAYNKYMQEAETFNEQQQLKVDWFNKKVDEVFNPEFKGFEFNVKDNKMVFSPSDYNHMKKMQSDPSNFIKKFVNEDGLLEDAVGYHKALAVAMNLDKFAEFFYEQGMSHAADDMTRKIKNVNMTERQAPEATTKGGVQVKVINPDSGRGLKIRSKNKS